MSRQPRIVPTQRRHDRVCQCLLRLLWPLRLLCNFPATPPTHVCAASSLRLLCNTPAMPLRWPYARDCNSYPTDSSLAEPTVDNRKLLFTLLMQQRSLVTPLRRLCDASTRLDCDACPRDAPTTAPRSLLPMPLTTALDFAPPPRFPCDASDTCPRSLLSATALQHARDASAMALRTRLQLLSD